MRPLIGITSDLDKEYLKIKKDYAGAVIDAGGLPFILAPVTAGTMEDLADAIDGLLLTGGNDVPPEYYGEALSVPPDILNSIEKARIDFEISLFKETMKRRKPILGICYGMQMVNVALGGNLYQDIEIQVKGAQNHRQGQHEIKIIHQLPIANYQSPVLVNSFHHQAVKKLANGLEAFAIAEDGIIEGFYQRDYPFLVSVQWHPERGMERDRVSLSLFRSFIEKSKKQK